MDKTRFIPLIEAAPFYLFCIRPRRFGKTLWLSVLQHYYDVNQTDHFDELFGDTDIGQQPTAERNSYLILFLNFAMQLCFGVRLSLPLVQPEHSC